MKVSVRIVAALLVVASQLGFEVRAQTLAPSFAALDVRQVAQVENAVQQPDGKIVATGSFTQVNNKAATGLVRLNADGSTDEAFTNAAACQAGVRFIRLFANGQLLLIGGTYDPIQVGGKSLQSVAKLNADGTLATGFNTGTGCYGGTITSAVIQPDGKVLLGGQFASFNGVASTGLVRLNLDGSVDRAFTTALGAGFTSSSAGVGTAQSIDVALRPDGKIVVVGYFRNYNGTGRSGLVRLNTDGSLDTTYNPPVATATGTGSYPFIYGVALDPRTQNPVLHGSPTTLGRAVVRLTAAGDVDPAFNLGLSLNCYQMYDTNDRLAVDAQGRVLFAGCYSSVNRALSRLLPDGSADPQFAVKQQLDYGINCLQPLADGTVLVGGTFRRYGTTRNVSLLRLDTNAQPVPSFLPLLTQAGSIRTLAVQPDSKILIGGNFCQLNGLAAGGVARLNADGTPDPAFTLAGTDGGVYKLLVQADGRIVLGGDFQRVGSHTSPFVARLLATGASDDTFTTTAYATSYSDPFYGGIKALAQRADGSLLVAGQNVTFNGASGTLHLLSTTGVGDAAYASRVGVASYYGSNDISAILPLSDGRHYVAGSFTTLNYVSSPNVVRLNADGTRDKTFAPTVASTPQDARNALLLPTGQLLLAGFSYAPSSAYSATRLTATGGLDATFAPHITGSINGLARYTNGRVLAAGYGLATDGTSTPGSLLRLNPDGSTDTSFRNIFPNTNYLVDPSFSTVVLQNDESILAAGYFPKVNGKPQQFLVRITAPNVLAVSSQQQLATTTAWPNPAHGQLQLALDAAAQPRTATLYDLAGRVALSQAITSPTATTLDISQLATGLYVLHVDYATGPVTRRITIE